MIVITIMAWLFVMLIVVIGLSLMGVFAILMAVCILENLRTCLPGKRPK